MKLQDRAKLINFNSVIVAIISSYSTIFLFLTMVLGVNKGFYLILPVLMILIMYSLIVSRKTSVKKAKKLGVLIGLIMFLYTISLITGAIGESRITVLFGYCIIPILCMGFEFSTKKVLEFVVYISLLFLPFVDKILTLQYVTLQQVDMSRAYALYVSISAAIIHFVWYRKESNYIIKACYFVNIYYLIRVIIVANRGLILCLFFLVFAVLFRLVRGKNNSKREKTKYTIILLASFVFVTVIVINLDAIIVGLYNYIERNFKTTPSFFIKSYKLIVYKNDLSNGRDALYDFFLEKIMQSPVWGYGFDSSGMVSNGVYPYPHNYIIQFLFEGGILFAALPLYKSFVLVINTFFSDAKNKDYYIISLFFLVNVIPKLLISGSVWNQSIFWLWMGLAFLNPYIIEKNFRFKRSLRESIREN